MSAPDAVLVFPPLNILVTHPELGIPQLTANLRKHGRTVAQADANMEFMYRHLCRPQVLERCFRELAWRGPRGDFLDRAARAMNAAKPAPLRLKLGRSPSRELYRRAARENLFSNVKETVPLPELPEALRPLAEPGAWRGFVELLDAVTFRPPSWSAEDVAALSRERFPVLEEFYAGFLDRVLARGAPKVFGVTLCSASQLIPALVLARLARERAPSSRIVAGGVWCTAAGELLPGFAAFFERFDAAVLHEGELPLLEILDRVDSGRGLEGIGGVVLRGRAPEPPAAPIPLEALEFPVYDGLPMDLYPMPTLAVRLTRGCHWAQCTFCYHVFPGYTELHSTPKEGVSDRHLSRILDHMDEMHRLYGRTHFTLSDNGAPGAVLRRFARSLRERGSAYTWESLARFDAGLDEAHFRDLAASGCKELFFGLETVTKGELDAFSKGIELEPADAQLRSCWRSGIAPFVFLLCHPLQPRESFHDTLRWVSERAETIYKVILFRFCLARFTRAFLRRAELGLRLPAGAEGWLDPFNVPYRAPGELAIDDFIREAEAFEAAHLSLRYSASVAPSASTTGGLARLGLTVWGRWPTPRSGGPEA
ncbi:MAG: hypothetical protein A2X36_16780 [Elusimicrobia bacterium GWA2_69_24]|nr:MAG: hypothetical protein A2X36_16780 [Elusimicrobia bacterium GWA2_69_24]